MKKFVAFVVIVLGICIANIYLSVDEKSEEHRCHQISQTYVVCPEGIFPNDKSIIANYDHRDYNSVSKEVEVASLIFISLTLIAYAYGMFFTEKEAKVNYFTLKSSKYAKLSVGMFTVGFVFLILSVVIPWARGYPFSLKESLIVLPAWTFVGFLMGIIYMKTFVNAEIRDLKK